MGGRLGWRLSIAIGAAVLSFAGAAAWAQSRETQQAECANKDRSNAPDLRIGACTALIQSGTLDAKTLAVAFYNRGAAYADNKDYDRAIADNDQAIRLDPSSAIAFYNRGVAYADKKDYDRAIADYDQAIRLDPNYAHAFNNRGVAYESKKDYDRAIADYDQAIRIDPNYADALNGACWDRALTNRDLATARRDCDAAVRLSHNDPNDLNSRGLLNLKDARFADAWADYDAAFRAQPASADDLYGRGIAALRIGQAEPGRRDLAAALKIDPNIAKTYAGYGVTP